MCVQSTQKEMDDDNHLDIERVLERCKSICEKIGRYEARKLKAENKSKFSQIELNRVVIDLSQLFNKWIGESNILR